MDPIGHGGNLSMGNHFLLLAEIGVALVEDTSAEIVRRNPYLTGVSPIAYKALKGTTHPLSRKRTFPKRTI